MFPAGSEVTVEKLDRIYFCAECKMVFLFKADVREHGKMTGHAEAREMPFAG
jgi:hypothetical protein